jgi:type IV pilus assembly protein PilO
MELRLDQLQSQAEKIAKLPKSYRLGLLGGIAFAFVALYAYIFFLPAHQELSQAEAQELNLQRQLSEVRAVVTNMAQFEKELADLERHLARALRRLPDSKELPVLLTDISSIAKDAGLELKTFDPGQDVARDFYAEVPIEVEFSGHFHDIARFFDRISRLPRIVNIQTLEIETHGESSAETLLRVRGEAVTFRFLESEASARAKGRMGPEGGRA